MQEFEYKVVPAPHKGTKAKGVKTPEDRFAYSIETVLNQMAAEGWEYQRAELLPSDERTGLTGSTTNWRNLLIFRRALTAEPPEAEEKPEQAVEEPTPPLTATAGDPHAPEGATPVPGPGATQMQADDGVEETSPVAGVTTALKTRASLTATRDLPEDERD